MPTLSQEERVLAASCHIDDADVILCEERDHLRRVEVLLQVWYSSQLSIIATTPGEALTGVFGDSDCVVESTRDLTYAVLGQTLDQLWCVGGWHLFNQTSVGGVVQLSIQNFAKVLGFSRANVLRTEYAEFTKLVATHAIKKAFLSQQEGEVFST